MSIITYLTRLGVALTAVIVLGVQPLPLAVRALCIALIVHGWLCGD